MQCIFIGVGEAFDERHPNTSLLARAGGAGMLLDCGFTAAAAYFRHAPEPDSLRAVYISHFHGDHFCGLPYLLARFKEEGRTRPLAVIGRRDIQGKVERLLKLSYRSVLETPSFRLDFHEAGSETALDVAGFRLRFAPSAHSQPCLAVRVEADGASLFYSGDGRPTAETLALAQNAGLVAHEAYHLDRDVPGHGTVDGALDFARQADAQAVALVHIERGLRRNGRERILNRMERAGDLRALLPVSGDTVDIP
jgi:ribonuclease BN (tRNA processing enzyme)